MIHFDIELNGDPYCRAGLDGYGVVSVMLHWMDFDGNAVIDDRGDLRAALTLSVSGHRAERPYRDSDVAAGREPPPMKPIHWRDVRQGLQAGDEVRIRIVDADPATADPPTETPMLPELEG